MKISIPVTLNIDVDTESLQVDANKQAEQALRIRMPEIIKMVNQMCDAAINGETHARMIAQINGAVQRRIEDEVNLRLTSKVMSSAVKRALEGAIKDAAATA